METLPMPLESLSASNGGLDEFASPRRARSSRCFKQFQDGNLLLNLNGSNGAMLSTTLWSLDPTRASSASAPTPARR